MTPYSIPKSQGLYYMKCDVCGFATGPYADQTAAERAGDAHHHDAHVTEPAMGVE